MVSPVTDDIRIMLVEDVDFNLEILTSILAERGWQTVTATSGEAALDILAHDAEFQVILMDIGLPGIDGLEATRRIKKDPATHAIPVIALTAEPASERDFLAAGFDGYAEKNFDPDQLFAAIEKHLSSECKSRHKSTPSSTDPAHLIDLDFETLRATYPSEEALCRIARAFFADTDKELALLTTAMAKFDQEKILACCHNLKGTSAIFTAQKLITAVKDLESCVREKNKNKVESAWHNVLAAHESLRVTVSCRLTL